MDPPENIFGIDLFYEVEIQNYMFWQSAMHTEEGGIRTEQF